VLVVLAVALVVVALVAAGLHGTRRNAAARPRDSAAICVSVCCRVGVHCRDPEVHHWARQALCWWQGQSVQLRSVQGTEGLFSLPSAHAVTAFALAFAVSALWPRLRVFMFTYAIVILLTRLVLLAHHPSDVVAGALVGMVGAMAVRYWFAARRLGFAIRADGTIVAAPRTGRRAPQKGCPRGIRPIKAAACRDRRFPEPIPRTKPIQPRAFDLSSSKPSVSIVVPVRNEPTTLRP